MLAIKHMKNLPIVVAVERGKYTKWARSLAADSLLALLRVAGRFRESVSRIRADVGCAIGSDVDFFDLQFIPAPKFIRCGGPEFRAEFGMELVYRVQSNNPFPDIFGPDPRVTYPCDPPAGPSLEKPDSQSNSIRCCVKSSIYLGQ